MWPMEPNASFLHARGFPRDGCEMLHIYLDQQMNTFAAGRKPVFQSRVLFSHIVGLKTAQGNPGRMHFKRGRHGGPEATDGVAGSHAHL
jgi:hypothetical protein